MECQSLFRVLGAWFTIPKRNKWYISFWTCTERSFINLRVAVCRKKGYIPLQGTKILQRRKCSLFAACSYSFVTSKRNTRILCFLCLIVKANWKFCIYFRNLSSFLLLLYVLSPYFFLFTPFKHWSFRGQERWMSSSGAFLVDGEDLGLRPRIEWQLTAHL